MYRVIMEDYRCAVRSMETGVFEDFGAKQWVYEV